MIKLVIQIAWVKESENELPFSKNNQIELNRIESNWNNFNLYLFSLSVIYYACSIIFTWISIFSFTMRCWFKEYRPNTELMTKISSSTFAQMLLIDIDVRKVAHKSDEYLNYHVAKTSNYHNRKAKTSKFIAMIYLFFRITSTMTATKNRQTISPNLSIVYYFLFFYWLFWFVLLLGIN